MDTEIIRKANVKIDMELLDTATFKMLFVLFMQVQIFPMSYNYLPKMKI